MHQNRYRREIVVSLTYVGLLGVLAVFAPGFYRGNQFVATLVASVPVLVAAIGTALVILTRQIDISIGSQFAVCGIAAGLLAKAGVPMPAVLLSVLVLGTLLGAANGALVAWLRLPSIVVTLATMIILREGLRWAREGEFVGGLPASFQWFGLSQETGTLIIIAIGLTVFALVAYGLTNLRGGRAVFATGSDPQAAYLAGIRPNGVTFWVFVAAGMLTGLASLLHSARFAAVDPFAGTGLELTAIAAVVLGGVAISGGRGTLVGPLFGVLLLTTIRPALVFLGAEAHWERAIQGGIILLAVTTDAWRADRKRLARGKHANFATG